MGKKASPSTEQRRPIAAKGEGGAGSGTLELSGQDVHGDEFDERERGHGPEQSNTHTHEHAD